MDDCRWCSSRLLFRVSARAFETEEWVTVEKLVSLFLVARTGRTLCMGFSDHVWSVRRSLTSLAHPCYSSFRVSVQRGFVRPNSGKEPAFPDGLLDWVFYVLGAEVGYLLLQI